MTDDQAMDYAPYDYGSGGSNVTPGTRGPWRISGKMAP
jgi:hypothetical protein